MLAWVCMNHAPLSRPYAYKDEQYLHIVAFQHREIRKNDNDRKF